MYPDVVRKSPEYDRLHAQLSTCCEIMGSLSICALD